MKANRHRALLVVATVVCVFAQESVSLTDPWKAGDIVRPAELAAALAGEFSTDRVLLHVGFPVLYRGAHIPASQFAGPGNKAEGIEGLRKGLAGVPKNKVIVLYCGCCPWERCPNLRPAFRAAREMGFTNVKVLSIPTNMRTDWIEKGYPIVKPSATGRE